MKIKKVFAVVLVAAALIMAVVAWFVLPQSVIIQITFDGSSPTAAPKLLAILLPFAISFISGMIYLFTAKEGKGDKLLILSAVGVIIFIFTFFLNL